MRLGAFILGSIMLPLSPLILPIVVIVDFLYGRNLSLTEGVLHMYYGLLGGWGERLNKPIAHLISTGFLGTPILVYVRGYKHGDIQRCY